ncbi:hypothetical protein DMENIID0001_170270 [Sergentomyia squamirostris]
MAPPSRTVPVFPKLKNLKIIADNHLIYGHMSLMNGFLDSVAATDSVEDLCIDGSVDFDFGQILPKFTKLQRFEVSMVLNEFEESHLLAINMESRGTLEHLDISKTDQITEEALLQFIKDCPKLSISTFNLMAISQMTSSTVCCHFWRTGLIAWNSVAIQRVLREPWRK